MTAVMPKTTDSPNGRANNESSACDAATAGEAGTVLFFDGVCGLCNGVVNFVMARDRAHHFRYAPLQGETAGRLLGEEFTRNLSTMVVRIDQVNFTKSAAVVRVLWQLSWGWQLLGSVIWLIPKPLRDLGYRIVARNRYFLFGKHDTCRMPSATERTLFLD